MFKLILYIYIIFLILGARGGTIEFERDSKDIQKVLQSYSCNGEHYKELRNFIYYNCTSFYINIRSSGFNTYSDKKKETGIQRPEFTIISNVHVYSNNSKCYDVLLDQEVWMSTSEPLVNNVHEHLAYFQTKCNLTNIFYGSGTLLDYHPETTTTVHEKTTTMSKRKNFFFNGDITIKEDPEFKVGGGGGADKTNTQSETVELTDWKIKANIHYDTSSWAHFLNYPFDAEHDKPSNFRSWVGGASDKINPNYVGDKYIFKHLPPSSVGTYKFNAQSLFRADKFKNITIHLSFDHILGDAVVGSHFISHMQYKEVNYFYYQEFDIQPPPIQTNKNNSNDAGKHNYTNITT